MAEENRLAELRDEITRLLAAALAAEERHDAELRRHDERHLHELARRDELHTDELARRDELHTDELARRDELHVAETMGRDRLHIAETAHRNERHEAEVTRLRKAAADRDTLGQAKGVVMVTLACSPSQALDLIHRQAELEQRPVEEIAAEIAVRASTGLPAGLDGAGPAAQH